MQNDKKIIRQLIELSKGEHSADYEIAVATVRNHLNGFRGTDLVAEEYRLLRDFRDEAQGYPLADRIRAHLTARAKGGRSGK